MLGPPGGVLQGRQEDTHARSNLDPAALTLLSFSPPSLHLETPQQPLNFPSFASGETEGGLNHCQPGPLCTEGLTRQSGFLDCQGHRPLGLQCISW
jgi:hypothetical protein